MPTIWPFRYGPEPGVRTSESSLPAPLLPWGRHRPVRVLICFILFSISFCCAAEASFRRPRRQDERANKAEPVQLAFGEAHPGNIAGGQRLSFQIELAGSQYATVTVEQRGIDLVVRLKDQEGKALRESDSDLRLTGVETIEIATDQPGIFTIEVEGKYKGLPSGGYEIRISEPRSATDKDRKLEEARRLDEERRELLAARKPKDALPAAQRCLKIYLEETGEQSYLTARATENLAAVYSASGDSKEAERLIRQAIGLYEKLEGNDHTDLARSLNLLGVLCSRRRDYAASEPLFQRSIQISEELLGPGDPTMAAPLLNLGNLHTALGDYAKAESLYTRAVALRQTALGADNPLTAAATSSLAGVLLETGEYDKAEPLYIQSIQVIEKDRGPNDLTVALLVTNLGLLYREKGDFAGAASYFRRASAVYEKTLGPESYRAGQELEYLAGVYRLSGDYVTAEPLYRKAAAVLEKALGPDSPELALTLGNLGSDLSDKRDYAEAESLFQRALAISTKAYGPEHPDVGSALHNLGDLYLELGQFAKAEDMLTRAVRVREKTLGPQHPKLLESVSDLARLYLAQGRTADAIACQRRANLIDEHNLALNLASGSERQKMDYLDFFSHAAQMTIAMQTQYAPADQGALELALTTVLQRKGRVLDALSRTKAALIARLSGPDKELLDRLDQTTARLARLVLTGPQGTAIDEHQRRIAALEQERDSLEAELGRRSAGFYRGGWSPSIKAVKEALPPGSALIEFAVYRPPQLTASPSRRAYGPARYVAYILRSSGELSWRDLGEAAPLDHAIDGFRAALRDPARGDVEDLSRALDHLVMEPVRPVLTGVSQLLISPDGELSLIPFAALLDESSRFLVERYSISYLTSGSDLLRPRPAVEKVNGPLVIANPLFGEPNTGSSTRPSAQSGTSAAGKRKFWDNNRARQQAKRQTINEAADLSGVYFAPLGGTAEEAKAIGTLFPDATILTGPLATKDAIKHAVAPRILHIATHGFFLSDRPSAETSDASGPLASGEIAKLQNPLLRSGLALAGANLRSGDRDDSGILTALEASGLNLWGSKLVVLSACDTGVGEIRNGEGVYGLRRAFVLAGAETLVMSLWPVSDYVTRKVMTEYYTNLKAGLGRGEALRRGQLDMLRQKDRRHPFYWASFIQSGDWRPLSFKR